MKGKALEKLQEHIFSEYQIDYYKFSELPLVCQQALWVEFFESVGIICQPRYNEVAEQFMPQIRFKPMRDDIDLKPFYKTRPEALSKAIEKAIEIFNNQSK